MLSFAPLIRSADSADFKTSTRILLGFAFRERSYPYRDASLSADSSLRKIFNYDQCLNMRTYKHVVRTGRVLRYSGSENSMESMASRY